MSVSDQRSQREVVEAAVVEAVAKVLHDHGPLSSHGEATARWQDCPNGEIHGSVADKVASTPTVQALLDVVETLDYIRGHLRDAGARYEGMYQHVLWRQADEALARLPEEVRRG